MTCWMYIEERPPSLSPSPVTKKCQHNTFEKGLDEPTKDNDIGNLDPEDKVQGQINAIIAKYYRNVKVRRIKAIRRRLVEVVFCSLQCTTR